MTHTKCDNCGKDFPDEEIENHKLYCLYTIQNSELENLIPCEICNQLINFDSYHQHLLTCYIPVPSLNSTNFPRLASNTYLGGYYNQTISTSTTTLLNNIRSVNSILTNHLNDYENLLELNDNNHLLGTENISEVIEATEEDGICPICTENICGLYKTKCGHLFCEECIKEWLSENKKCPVCMKEF